MSAIQWRERTAENYVGDVLSQQDQNELNDLTLQLCDDSEILQELRDLVSAGDVNVVLNKSKKIKPPEG